MLFAEIYRPVADRARREATMARLQEREDTYFTTVRGMCRGCRQIVPARVFFRDGQGVAAKPLSAVREPGGVDRRRQGLVPGATFSRRCPTVRRCTVLNRAARAARTIAGPAPGMRRRANCR